MPELDVNTVALARREKEEAEWESRPFVDWCIFCGEAIKGQTERYEGDWYVDSPDGPVHWDCWEKYGESLLKEG